MLKKQLIVDVIKQMPGDELDLDDLKEKLYLLQELQKAEDDIEAGRTFSNNDMKQMIESWRQSPGQILPKAI